MNDPCILFRRALMDALSTESAVAHELGWHEHVLTCAACREVLEREEALEMLLASLPEPRLPEALAERVLARLAPLVAELRDAGDGSLESLLALDRAPDVPSGLAQRILEGVAAERAKCAADASEGSVAASVEPHEAALDRVLARVPEPTTPSGLAQRVLAGLAAERRAVVGVTSRSAERPLARQLRAPARSSAPTRTRARRSALGTGALLALAAAAVLVLFLVLRKDRPSDDASSAPVTPFANGPRESELVARVDEGAPVSTPGSSGTDETRSVATDPTDSDATHLDPTQTTAGSERTDAVELELLEALELLENWEAITSDDLDLLLAELDELDATLLEHLPTEEDEG